MQIVKLDSNSTVIECFPLMNPPALIRFSADYALAPPGVEPGSVLQADGSYAKPARRRWITNLAFDNRFTDAELVSIKLAALVDPAMTVDQKRQALLVQVSLDKAAKARYADLDRPDTRAGVQAFEQFSLIAPGRAAEILDGAIADHEYHPDA